MAERKHREDETAHRAVKLPLFSAAHERVGEIEVAGAVFGRDGDISLAARSGEDAAGQSALRNRVDQDQGIHLGRRPQAVAAKGYRTRARRLDSLADLASWRNDLRAAAARLFVQDAEEGVARARYASRSRIARRTASWWSSSRWSCRSRRPRRPRRRSTALGRQARADRDGRGRRRVFSAPRATWPRIRCSRLAGLNVYDVLNYDELLMTSR